MIRLPYARTPVPGTGFSVAINPAGQSQCSPRAHKGAQAFPMTSKMCAQGLLIVTTMHLPSPTTGRFESCYRQQELAEILWVLLSPRVLPLPPWRFVCLFFKAAMPFSCEMDAVVGLLVVCGSCTTKTHPFFAQAGCDFNRVRDCVQTWWNASTCRSTPLHRAGYHELGRPSHGSGLARVTRPDPTRDISKPPGPTRPKRWYSSTSWRERI